MEVSSGSELIFLLRNSPSAKITKDVEGHHRIKCPKSINIKRFIDVIISSASHPNFIYLGQTMN